MRENSDLAWKMLGRCFNVTETDYLQSQVKFQSALLSMNNLDDCEAVVAIGSHLLDERAARALAAPSVHRAPAHEPRSPLSLLV